LKRANAYRASKQFELAEKDLRDLDRQYLTLLSNEQKGQKAYLEGMLLFNTTDPLPALEKYKAAEQFLTSVGPSMFRWRIQAVIQQSRCLAYLGQHVEADARLASLMQSLPENKRQKSSQMRIWATRSFVAARALEFDREVEFALKAHNLANELFGVEHQFTAESLNRLGLAYLHAGQKELGLSTLKRSIAVLEAETPNDPDLVMPLINYSRYSTSIPNKRDALERALAIAKRRPKSDQGVGVMIRKELLPVVSLQRKKELKTELCVIKVKEFCLE
jgi:tetratricopeptide (TPR) repeat protein